MSLGSFEKSLMLLLAIMTLGVMSCKKFVEIEPAPGLLLSENVFSSDQSALSAASGVYVSIRTMSPGFLNGAVSLFGSLSACETINTSASSQYDPFYKSTLTADNLTISTGFWGTAYKIIYATNAVLSGLSKTENVSVPLKRQLIGEMKLIRALAYFYLVNLFGEVPLILTTDYEQNSFIARSPVSIIYSQILNDLNESKTNLNNDYPTSGKVRPNKMAAVSLLSRVYLYLKKWKEAEEESSLIINSNLYELLSLSNNIFRKNSAETIWEIAAPNEERGVAEAPFYLPTSPTSRPTVMITSHLFSAFEQNDRRLTNWVGKNTVNVSGQPTPFYYIKKYQNRNILPPTENQIVLRLAEQYLIRAEARTQSGNFEGAKSDLNLIRSRAGLANISFNNVTDLMTAIMHERQVELFGEWAHRWLDLKRWNLANAVLQPLKSTTWESSDQLYPIPLTDLRKNTLLTQNPGY